MAFWLACFEHFASFVTAFPHAFFVLWYFQKLRWCDEREKEASQRGQQIMRLAINAGVAAQMIVLMKRS